MQTLLETVVSSQRMGSGGREQREQRSRGAEGEKLLLSSLVTSRCP